MAGTGVIIETNDGWNRVFGYDAGELVGRHVSELTATSNERVPGARMRSIAARVGHGDAWRGTTEHVCKDGSRFVSSTRITEIEDETDGPLWMVVASRVVGGPDDRSGQPVV